MASVSQALAQGIIDLFNTAPTQQKYTITIQDSSGNKATTTFTFSLQKPNVFSEIGQSLLQPWNWGTVAGEVWTGVTTGNSDVTLITSSPLLISNTQNILLDNQHPLGTESLDISTPANLFDFLYHQINNAVNVTAKLIYCSSSGAIVGLQVTPNTGAIESAGYSVFSAEGMIMGGTPYALNEKQNMAFLQVGSPDSQLVSIAQTPASASNPEEVYGTGNGNTSSNTSSNNTTVVTPTTPSSGGSSASSGGSSGSTSSSSSNGYSSTSNNSGSSGVSTYGTSPGITLDNGQSLSAAQNTASQYPSTVNSSPSSGSSKTTEYLLIGGGIAAAVVVALLFMQHKKH